MIKEGYLADVHLLPAVGWDTHPRHIEARRWMLSTEGIHSCDVTELGFLHPSITQAFKSTMSEATGFLREIERAGIVSKPTKACAVVDIPTVISDKETTDAYLVHLASTNGLALATLDQPLLGRSWSSGIAFDSLHSSEVRTRGRSKTPAALVGRRLD